MAIKEWQQQQQPLAQICNLDFPSMASLALQPGLPKGSALVEHTSERHLSAKRLLAAIDTPAAGNFKDALLASFELKCRTVTEAFAEPMEGEEPQPVDAGKPKSKAKPPCYQVGYCICGLDEDGCKFYAVLERVIVAMKLQFPKVSHFRASHLRASRVFLMLRGSLAAESSEAAETSTATHIWHVGILYLIPWRPTLRVCLLANPEEPWQPEQPVDVIGSNQYMTLVDAVRGLDLGLTWDLRMYQLRESERSLGRFDPSKVTMVPYQTGADVGFQLWPKPKRGRGKGKGSRTKHHDACDGGPDEAGDEHDDHSGDSEGALNSEEEHDPEAIEDIAASRELKALLEESLEALRTRSKKAEASSAGHGDDEAPDDPGPLPRSETPVPHSPNTSDISLTPLGSELVSSDSEAPAASATKSSVAARMDADLVLEVSGGTIRYYKKSNNFTATCDNHCKCVKTRQSVASKASGSAANTAANRAKGRPLGYLASWLSFGSECTSKKKHWDNKKILEKCGHSTRLVKRYELQLMAGGPAMLECEREPRDGEGDEPAGMP